ncbi:hypothetical protein D918_06826 [Trichuris suis]|nr:hypothetical protein D918_06826 [Trichuris suis]
MTSKGNLGAPPLGLYTSAKFGKGRSTKKGKALTALLVAFVGNRPVKSLLTVENFARIPAEWQKELISLLPKVDQSDPTLQSNIPALNNEYFSYACVQFSDCLKNAKVPQQLKRATRALFAKRVPESVSKNALYR